MTIDDDLQNPPEEIPRLLDALSTGIDVVYGTPATTAQRRWRAASGTAMRLMLARILGVEGAQDLSSFRAFRSSLRDGFDDALGPAVTIDALLSWSTSRFASVTVEHHDRTEGKSNYSFRKLLRFAFDTSTGYSAAPLQGATIIGAITALFGVGVLVWVAGQVLIVGESARGFPFLASIIAIFAGAQLVALGIIGEYLARMHFRIMRKPTYFIAETVSGHDRSAERQ